MQASIGALNTERTALISQIDEVRSHLSQDIAQVVGAANMAQASLKDGLSKALDNNLGQVAKLGAEAVKVGRELGEIEEIVKSNQWLKALVSLLREEPGVTKKQVRSNGLMVMKSMLSWLTRECQDDPSIVVLKTCLNSSIKELEKWKS